MKRQKKIVVGRQSGLPIQIEKLNEYKAEFQTRFDELKKLHGSEMLGFSEGLQKVDLELSEKYALVEDWDLPKSFKSWRDLIDVHGNFIITANKHTGELMMFILDEEFGQ